MCFLCEQNEKRDVRATRTKFFYLCSAVVSDSVTSDAVTDCVWTKAQGFTRWGVMWHSYLFFFF